MFGDVVNRGKKSSCFSKCCGQVGREFFSLGMFLLRIRNEEWIVSTLPPMKMDTTTMWGRILLSRNVVLCGRVKTDGPPHSRHKLHRYLGTTRIWLGRRVNLEYSPARSRPRSTCNLTLSFAHTTHTIFSKADSVQILPHTKATNPKPDLRSPPLGPQRTNDLLPEILVSLVTYTRSWFPC